MTELIAHRGFAEDNPENTLRAFRQAASTVAMVELDVRRCGTGEVVVFHDETLERATGREVAVAETPYEVLAAADLFGSGEGVPLLTDVFELLPTSVGLNVELKTAEVVADAVDVAAAYPHDVIVSSFLPEARAEARTAADLPLALLFTEEYADGAVDRAVEEGCAAIHPPKNVVTSGFVDAAHEHDLQVNAWNVKSSEEATRLVDAGVDGLIADSADVLKH